MHPVVKQHIRHALRLWLRILTSDISMAVGLGLMLAWFAGQGF